MFLFTSKREGRVGLALPCSSVVLGLPNGLFGRAAGLSGF